MNKIVIGGIAAALSVATAAGTGAFAAGQGGGKDGNPGARKVALVPTTGSNNSECQPAGSGSSNFGFAIVNAPGKPDLAQKVNGEVSLKNDTPGSQTYIVNIADPANNTCMMTGTLATNAHGNGNSHIDMPDLTSGTYYIVLQDVNNGAKEKYATAPVTVR